MHFLRKNDLIFILTGILFLFSVVSAASKPPKEKITADIDPAIRYLYQRVNQSALSEDFDPEKVATLVRFVTNERDTGEILYYPGDEVVEGSSAYYRTAIEQPLEHVLAYIRNPDIPRYIFNPLVVRYSQWKNTPANLQSFYQPDVDLSVPRILKGVKHVCTTPHPNMRGYFEYDTRLLQVRFRFDDQPVYIDISKMIDRSDVARKGGSIGPMDNWLFYYLDETGLNKLFLGWVKAYIYKNVSLTVFVGQGDSTRIGFFKWIESGWAGVDFASRRRVYKGLKKYADQLNNTIFSPDIPEPGVLAEKSDELAQLSESELRRRVKALLTETREKLGDEAMFSNDRFRRSYQSGDYFEQLSRVEMEAMLAKAFFKSRLGRNNVDKQGD